jgi:hypothetical protein
MVSLDNCGHDGQPQTGAAGCRIRRPRPAGITASEPLEDAVRHFRRDPRSVVGHCDNRLRAEDGDPGVHLRSGRRVGTRIRQQVGHYLLESVSITVREHRVMKQAHLPHMIRTGSAGIAHSIDHNLAQVSWL